MFRRLLAGVVALVLPFVFAPPASASNPLCWPVSGHVTQYYSSYHPAIDIGAYYGNPVYAAAPGVVTWAGWKNNGGGYVVDIDHGGIVTSSNHLSAVYVVPGQAVGYGTPIGAVGATGHATGPHVHFAVLAAGAWQNPLAYLSCPLGWTPPPPTWAWTEPGDTVEMVARQFHVPVTAFRSWNQRRMLDHFLAHDYEFTPGTKVKVRGSTAAALTHGQWERLHYDDLMYRTYALRLERWLVQYPY